MYHKKKMIMFVLMFLTGIGIVAASLFLDDHSYWSGFGGGLVGISGMKLFQGIQYRKNPDFAREVDTNVKDERNMFLAERARSVTCAVSFVVLAFGSIILRLVGLVTYSNLCAFTICGMLAVYCLVYWLIRKKY